MPQEVLLTTSRHQHQISATLWDPLTGNTLHTYKNGGIVAPKSLTLLSFDYLLTVEEAKPVTHLWPLNSQEPDKKLSTILSDQPACVTLSPDSAFLAAGIGPKLHIWQLSSGKLLCIQKKHYQSISCLKFSLDGSCLLAAGNDGMLVVYKLAALISLHSNLASESEGQIEPLYTKSDHSLPISDLYVGHFGLEARFVTASLDNTVKLYALKSGALLLNLIFDEPVTSVILDAPCWNLFVGCESGKIQQFHLTAPSRVTQHVSNELVFVGHKQRVTCLDLSVFNGLLVSGAEDCFVFVWEVASRQILRRIEHKGAVTNVRCVVRHANFTEQNLRVGSVWRNLEREVVREEEFVCGKIQREELVDSDEDECEEIVEKRIEDENKKLRAANQALYEMALKIVKKCHNV